MNEAIFTQLQKEMDHSVGALRKELTKLRTGRASTALLEHITVDYYGASTPLNQLATLSAPEPRLLVVQPFDRGAMGEIGLVCLDCHMPESSAEGHRRTHLWRINTTTLTEEENTKTEPNDSGTPTKFWMNYDGTTGAGDSFITLDIACGGCHENRTMEQLARAAKYIHRQPGLVDLTINGGDSMQFVTKSELISVDFAVYPKDDEGGDKTGMPADFWILSQGPSGWKYWNPAKKTWKSGLKVSQKGVMLNEASQNVYSGKLSAGSYTYWVQIFSADGGEYVDSVPVYVSKK
jgi:hypothetical protein